MSRRAVARAALGDALRHALLGLGLLAVIAIVPRFVRRFRKLSAGSG